MQSYILFYKYAKEVCFFIIKSLLIVYYQRFFISLQAKIDSLDV